MKRNKFFWPVLSAAAVFVLWVVFCFFVVGLVIGAPTSRAQVARPFTVPTYWSPAANLLNVRQSRTLAGLLASAVNGLWRVAPYCRAPRPQADPEEHHEQVEMLVLRHYYHSGGGGGLRQGHMVVLRPKTDWTPYLASIISVWPPAWVCLSPGEVLVYVTVFPGAHFALVAFILVAVITMLVRLLIRPTPEGVAPPPRGEEGGAQP